MSLNLLSLRGLIPTIIRLQPGDAASQSGVLLQPADDVLAREHELQSASAISVQFPKFTDGRGYSIASVLRQRVGYEGPLRAVGDVLVDQLSMMARVGFDEFELRFDQDPQLALRALRTFSLRYQQAAGDAAFAHSGALITPTGLPTNSPIKKAVVIDQQDSATTESVAT